MPENRKVIVIGGGAAGMMAALFAAREGAEVLLLERNEKLGKKIYITGKGRCNVTNDAEREKFLNNVLRNPRFLFSALHTLNQFGLMKLLEEWGTPVKVERGGRVFPQSDHASDVTRALERAILAAGAQIRLNARVTSVTIQDDRVTGVTLEDGRRLLADCVILATGGLSYPSTGSTGDGHRMAEAVGHQVKKCLPALTSISTVEDWTARLSGFSLKNVRLMAYQGDKRLYSEQGEMLFTHTGISGPLVLTLSSLLPEAPEGVRLVIDLKPALDDSVLDQRILREFSEHKNRQLIRVADALMPHNLALLVLERSGLTPTVPVNQMNREMRKAFRLMIKNLPLTVKAVGGFSEAVITRGGVAVKEVNPSTMESKKTKGLFFVGELLDVDALTGGYNLQIAFSTGALAGKSAGNSEFGVRNSELGDGGTEG